MIIECNETGEHYMMMNGHWYEVDKDTGDYYLITVH